MLANNFYLFVALKRLGFCFCLVAIVLSLNGCFLFSTIPYPKVQGNKLSTSEASKLLERLNSAAAIPYNQQDVILSRVRITDSKKHSRFKMLVTIQSDHQIKMELLPEQLAAPFAVLLETIDGASAVSNVEKVVVSTDDGSKLVDEIIGVPVSPLELGYLILGKLPTKELSSFDGSIFEDDNTLQFSHNNKLRFWSINKSDLSLKFIQFRASAKTSKVVEVSRSNNKISVVIPSEDISMSILITASKRMPREVLSLSAPNHFKKVEL